MRPISACGLGLLGLASWAAPKACQSSPRTLVTRFTYRAAVPEAPPGTRALDLWLPLPSDSPLQTVEDVRVEGAPAHRITRETTHGNRMVYVRGTGAPLAVSISFTVRRREARVPAGGASNPASSYAGQTPDRCLRTERMVPVGGRFGKIAREVAGGLHSTLERARALYEHVVASMQYDYKRESPRLGEGDVAFVCDYKKGNCSDLHSYLISLARSLRIPAFLEYGFPITGIPLADPLPEEGVISGYHCWAWVHDPEKGWLPLDASDGRRWLDSSRPDVKEQLFGNLVLERSAVAFSRGRDLTLSPPQKGGPLNYFIYPYAEADGRPVKATWEVRYRILERPAARGGSARVAGSR